MTRNTTLLLCIALLLGACGGHEESPPGPAAENPDPAHNSRNSLDWAGTYSGTVPCADCEGIATTVTLDHPDAYRVSLVYLGKSEEVFTKEGSFGWEMDGNRIRMPGTDGSPMRFLVGEEKLIQLDIQGERITGGLAEAYVLHRSSATSAWPLRGTYWKLVQIEGKPVQHPEGRMPANMLLSSEEERVSGNSGCNSFFSTFQLDETTGKIRFQKAGSTMMACADMSTETAFLKGLLQVNNYTLEGRTLSLRKAENTLLRFEALDM